VRPGALIEIIATSSLQVRPFSGAIFEIRRTDIFRCRHFQEPFGVLTFF
jgi:hypothetical protein